MIENVLRNLGGIGIYGIISVCLFFAFFSLMLVWAFRLKSSYLKSMDSLPLENEADPKPSPGKINSTPAPAVPAIPDDL